MRGPYAISSRSNLSAVLLSVLLLGHAHAPAMADVAPACSAGVRSQLANLCVGNFVGLGSLSSGAEVLLCMPPANRWNGDLITFARGITRFSENDCKLASMIGQLDLNGTSIPRLANQLGFGFATSSCSKDVLAIQECKADTVELGASFQDQLEALELQNEGVEYGTFSGRVFLTGASMGGLVATQLIERSAGLTLASTLGSRNPFAGALAACGPIGSFKRMVRYQGDLLVLVDALYREDLGQAFDPRGLVYPDPARKPVVPEPILNALDRNLCPALTQMIDADSTRARKVMRIMAAAGGPVATDPSGEHTVGEIMADIVCSDTLPVIPLFDDRFGGTPYGNATRVYVDPRASLTENLALNRRVDRFVADTGTEEFETTGQPAHPLVTLHTVLDPRVPFSQSERYTLKVVRSGDLANYTPIPSFHFGHCAFDEAEVLAAFAILYFEVTGFNLQGIEAALDAPEALQRFLDLVEEFDPAARFDDLVDDADDLVDDAEDWIDDVPWP
jgi:hypothetical protein